MRHRFDAAFILVVPDSLITLPIRLSGSYFFQQLFGRRSFFPCAAADVLILRITLEFDGWGCPLINTESCHDANEESGECRVRLF
jgi:hypothetical protein